MVDVEMRLRLKNCRDVRGESASKVSGKLVIFDGLQYNPLHVDLSISEADARELWTQIGLKLRNLNKEKPL